MAVFLGLAACAHESSGPAGADEVSSTPTVVSLPDAQDIVPEVTAAVAGSGAARVSLTASEVSAGGDLIFGADAAVVGLSLQVNDVQVLIADGRHYLNLGQASGGMYLVVDPAGRFAQTFGPVVTLVDPVGFLSRLGAAVTSIEQRGLSEEIDGVSTTPYVFTVDVPQGFTPEQAALLGLAGGTVEVTVLVGPDLLPRRFSWSGDGGAVTMDYTDWGTKAGIESPPDDFVVDGAEFGYV
ncbi:MAG: hypothetical protein QM597_03005 [Aeromicrobium sp.]|uniref:hypothetical protein n=1 Tax=Aeromicrobium sp. TaxID=1871063 RepID=UPI0039E60C5E